eukprot:365225-Pleurochrysis_carterae.AAC.1
MRDQIGVHDRRRLAREHKAEQRACKQGAAEGEPVGQPQGEAREEGPVGELAGDGPERRVDARAVRVGYPRSDEERCREGRQGDEVDFVSSAHGKREARWIGEVEVREAALLVKGVR